MTEPFIIAIDGPAASGKGTLSHRIAQVLGLRHLDTGLTYRAVAHALLSAGEPLDDEATAVAAAKRIDLGALEKSVLAQHKIGEAASKVAVMSLVRSTLVEQQRLFANALPGAVLDGRDIGTVVCPDAQVKLYVIASPQVRARRRWAEVQERGNLSGTDASFETILADIEARDARDMGRADSPLKPAQDATTIDTSDMSIDAAFEAAMQIIEQHRKPNA
ncbi:(d)CMP kinase [Pseudahrensia aquimaris]|uniref:Cytidylate kinase n=1 Tax=Pseudahrensia aquimaris TaxID=744461 RepID=A0ABW3FHD6_9HYPH